MQSAKCNYWHISLDIKLSIPWPSPLTQPTSQSINGVSDTAQKPFFFYENIFSIFDIACILPVMSKCLVFAFDNKLNIGAHKRDKSLWAAENQWNHFTFMINFPVLAVILQSLIKILWSALFLCSHIVERHQMGKIVNFSVCKISMKYEIGRRKNNCTAHCCIWFIDKSPGDNCKCTQQSRVQTPPEQQL